MKPIWKGVIAFGQVYLPIELFPASRTRRLNFELRRQADLCPVGYAYICKDSSERVEYDEIVRTYELEDGQVVVLESEDFERAEGKRGKTIRILGFLEEEQVPVEYFSKPYFIGAAPEGDQHYALLRETLRQTGRSALVQFVLRQKEHLGLITVRDEMLVLTIMRYQEQLRRPEGVAVSEQVQLDQEALAAAVELAENLQTEFAPQQYHDTYTEQLKQIIAEKVQGEELPEPGQTPEPTQGEDLVSSLRRSLRTASKRPGVRAPAGV